MPCLISWHFLRWQICADFANILNHLTRKIKQGNLFTRNIKWKYRQIMLSTAKLNLRNKTKQKYFWTAKVDERETPSVTCPKGPNTRAKYAVTPGKITQNNRKIAIHSFLHKKYRFIHLQNFFEGPRCPQKFLNYLIIIAPVSCKQFEYTCISCGMLITVGWKCQQFQLTCFKIELFLTGIIYINGGSINLFLHPSGISRG